MFLFGSRLRDAALSKNGGEIGFFSHTGGGGWPNSHICCYPPKKKLNPPRITLKFPYFHPIIFFWTRGSETGGSAGDWSAKWEKFPTFSRFLKGCVPKCLLKVTDRSWWWCQLQRDDEEMSASGASTIQDRSPAIIPCTNTCCNSTESGNCFATNFF